MEVVTSLPADTPLSLVAERVRRIEGLGFDTVHVSETVRDPFSVCAVATEHSSTVVIRTSMVVAFARSPMVTACAAWDLARFSGGRFHLGVASQVRGNMVGRYSVEWTEPVARLRDYVGAVRAIFEVFQSGGGLEYRGSHYTFTRLQPFFNPGPIDVAAPSIWTGGVNARMCALAGAVADGFVAHPTGSHPRMLAERVLPAVRAGAAECGRSDGGPRVVVVPKPITGRDEGALAVAREKARKELAFLYSTPAYRGTLDLLGFGHTATALSEAAGDKQWDRLTGLLTDEILDALVPQGVYADLPGVLAEWFGGVCEGIALDPPNDPRDDEEFGAMLARIRTSGGGGVSDDDVAV
ncbi:TIGR03617 family F420-dependent LLM class oxidoreductase [Nocardia sp. 2]|uniref:TIGR03617 family F420-dependent LLM class oxidoreductase n=1 Tax=Nocardia acididurans TaxID=2802282 RepID=A0ABS1M5M1_9NOCA|nr:TIGR03617 family F420-dependent LLM class oxidoreductase [Nocardia acididurans]MBL1075514.1 TIGR03617 family F420-dependent LLM class oxidoreductase [Nocardia acididurans]